jgi:TonB family protein
VIALAAALAMLGATPWANAQPAPRGLFSDPAMAEWHRGFEFEVDRQIRMLGPISIRGKTVVGLRIDQGGRLVEAKVIQSSGDTELGGAFLAAIRTAGPFAPLPAVHAGSLLSFTATMTSETRKGDFNGMKPIRPYHAEF